MREARDELAELLRLAYAEASSDHREHIQNSPWRTMPAERKQKWLHMADCAIAFAEENQ
jgi:hypothetical protein